MNLKALIIGDERWIKDDYKTPKFYIGVIFLILSYAGSIFTDQLAGRITSLLHPQYAYDTEEFYQFLATNPWDYTAVRIIWLILFFMTLYLTGLRFFYSYDDLDKKNLFKWFLLGIIILTVLQGISVWMTKVNGSMTANQELLNKQLVDANWGVKAVVFTLLPAFGEELVMRGVVQRYILPNIPYIGILASAFLFANLHYTTRISDTLLYFSSGLVFAIAYYKTERLEVTILLHALNNFIALILIQMNL